MEKGSIIMSSTRDQRIRRAPSKSPKKTDKSKSGTSKTFSSTSKESSFLSSSSILASSSSSVSAHPASKLSLGGSAIVRSGLPMTSVSRNPPIDTENSSPQSSPLRANRLRNIKTVQVKLSSSLKGILLQAIKSNYDI